VHFGDIFWEKTLATVTNFLLALTSLGDATQIGSFVFPRQGKITRDIAGSIAINFAATQSPLHVRL